MRISTILVTALRWLSLKLLSRLSGLVRWPLVNQLETRRDNEKKRKTLQLAEIRDQSRDSAEYKSRRQVRLTTHGAYHLIARRSLSCASARGVGFLLARDLHHQTICRWEIRMRAALNAAARHFFAKQVYQAATHIATGAPGMCIMITQFRADATNSAVWQKCKLHTTEVEICSTGPVHDDTSWEDTLSTLQEQRLLGDLQIVKDGTIAGTLGCIRKQLASVGACAADPSHRLALPDAHPAALLDLCDRVVGPSAQPDPPEPLALADAVDEADEISGPAAPSAPSNEHEQEQSHRSEPSALAIPAADLGVSNFAAIQMWLCCTDAGNDAKGSREFLVKMTAHNPQVIVWEMNCWCHQFQLIVKADLAMMDQLFTSELGVDYSAYASLSKTMLLWRGRSNNMFLEFCRLYGAKEAMEVARCIPPKCIRGRWGAVSACQRYLFKAPPGHVATVLKSVLAKNIKSVEEQEAKDAQAERNGKGNGRKGAKGAVPGGTEDPHYEESADYTKKFGRWAKDVLKSVTDDKWWAMMRISLKIRLPLDHFCHYLMKAVRENHQSQPVARLVWYKSDEIAKDLDGFTDHETWPEWLDERLVPEALVQTCRNIALKLALRNQADYHMRIHQLCDLAPFKLLHIAREEADVCCNRRKEICQWMLDTDDLNLHLVARKVKKIFHDEVVQGAESGTVGMQLWTAIRLVVVKWRPDVQEVEGINNIIQQVVRAAPRVTLPLLDARVGLRKMLGMGSRKARDKKWSQQAPTVAKLVDTAKTFDDHANYILAIKDRWVVPTKATISLTDDVVVNPSPLALTMPAAEFGHRAELSLMKQLREILAIDATYSNSIVQLSGVGDEAWVVSNKYSVTLFLRRCRLVQDPPAGAEAPDASVTPVAVFDSPAVIRPALQVFAEKYDAARPNNKSFNIKLFPLDPSRLCALHQLLALDASAPKQAPRVRITSKKAAAILDAPGMRALPAPLPIVSDPSALQVALA